MNEGMRAEDLQKTVDNLNKVNDQLLYNIDQQQKELENTSNQIKKLEDTNQAKTKQLIDQLKA